jgi:hypothetical protein
MEALLENQSLWRGRENGGGGGPILVVCLTNHALDQFLEGILVQLKRLFPNEDPGLIRVGGRTQSEALQEVSLQRKRMAATKMYLHSADFRRRKGAATRTVREIEVEHRDLLSEALQLGEIKGMSLGSLAFMDLFRGVRHYTTFVSDLQLRLIRCKCRKFSFRPSIGRKRLDIQTYRI